MANEEEATSGMENSPLKKGIEEERGQTRRAFVLGAGAAAAGLVVGGVVGGKLAGTGSIDMASVPYPSLWIGRNPEACTGCKLCEIACSQIKESKVWPAASRIQVHQYPPCVEFPVACYQCGPDSKCIQSCEVDALSINPEFSTIEVDVDKCLRTAENMRCIACAEACPGKTVFFHPATDAPLFCDLCGGEPACLEVCPSKAIMVRGASMAASPPDQIARSLGHMYDLPISRKPNA